MNRKRTAQTKEICEYISDRGYRYVKVKDSSEIKNGWEGYRPEHLVVMEEIIKRKIIRSRFGKGEGVHHIDGDKFNNKPCNLYLYKDESEHRTIHQSLAALAFLLVRNNLIDFDASNGKYRLSTKLNIFDIK